MTSIMSSLRVMRKWIDHMRSILTISKKWTRNGLIFFQSHCNRTRMKSTKGILYDNYNVNHKISKTRWLLLWFLSCWFNIYNVAIATRNDIMVSFYVWVGIQISIIDVVFTSMDHSAYNVQIGLKVFCYFYNSKSISSFYQG
jgi:hypothetical protein